MVRVGRGVWGDAGGIDATFKGMGDTWEVTPGSVPEIILGRSRAFRALGGKFLWWGWGGGGGC